MEELDIVCMWIAEIIPLIATLFSFIFGLRNFFKKGKPLFLQSITMAMGCYSLGSIYHLCQTITLETVIEGFTPAYLGRIGFFLFFIVASYGQMDRIVDDGTAKIKPCRYIALIAPICAAFLFIPNAVMEDLPLFTKISVLLVWLPATVSVYYNLKHAIIPDCDFGFIKAIRPYNVLAVCLAFSELCCLTAWDYLYSAPLVITTVIFSIICIATMLLAKKGAEQWKI
ncbi:MAG: hypothetical protein E7358_02115 [Clostridiales bacterium]|nr:hypothetical protein [Clostridiales bacterium]